MPIINVLNASANAMHAIFEISTHNWNKRSLITLGITVVAFIGVSVLIANLESDAEEKAKENENVTADGNDIHVNVEITE